MQKLLPVKEQLLIIKRGTVDIFSPEALEKKLEFAHTISPLENPMTIRGLRRDIARLITELKLKQDQA